jgi:hypothetical protein
MPVLLSYSYFIAVMLRFFHPTRRLFSSSVDQFALMAADRCFISSGVGSMIGRPDLGGLGLGFSPRCLASRKSWLCEILSSLQISSYGTFVCQSFQRRKVSTGVFRMIPP